MSNKKHKHARYYDWINANRIFFGMENVQQRLNSMLRADRRNEQTISFCQLYCQFSIVQMTIITNAFKFETFR